MTTAFRGADLATPCGRTLRRVGSGGAGGPEVRFVFLVRTWDVDLALSLNKEARQLFQCFPARAEDLQLRTGLLH